MKNILNFNGVKKITKFQQQRIKGGFGTAFGGGGFPVEDNCPDGHAWNDDCKKCVRTTTDNIIAPANKCK